MEMKQISVFLENNVGRIGEVTRVLAEAGVNMQAISIADTADFGILRLIVNNNEYAVKALNDAGFTTRETSVAAVEIEDVPGSLAKIMELFQRSRVNIEYLYSSPKGGEGKAVVIFKLEDHAKGMRIIQDCGLSAVNLSAPLG
ncbi:MAG: amino acid-binding protein [Spirochaetaceae bacterium]|jgi:hypothetical protein|nr:amino acid-binding protein [Spirochaetaceae bacterium]